MRFYLVLLIFAHFTISTCARAATPAFPIYNASSFYLYSKESGAGCPAIIAPGQSAVSSEYWCGFLACATSQYDPAQGCMEYDSNKLALTQGGYATWFSISFANKLVSIPEGNIYQGNIDGQNKFTLQYQNITQKYSSGPHQGQVVALPKITEYRQGPKYRGINISGLEYDGTFLDALYQHPDIPDVRYFAEQGMNTVRLPIRWEFVLGDKNNLVESRDPENASINTFYMASVLDTVAKYLDAGLNVVLDLHNYMRFCPTGAAIGQANEPTDAVKNDCRIVSSEQLAYIWGILAEQFNSLAQKYPQQLIFEIMNEPFADFNNPSQNLASEDLLTAEVAAVQAIRARGLENLILLSGNYWDPMHGWVDQSPSATVKPNGVIFSAENLNKAGIKDLGQIAIDMHQYLDHDFSGRNEQCQVYSSYEDFKEKMHFSQNGVDILGNWIKANHMKVFLGEFGSADNAQCRQAMGYLLQYVDEHAYQANYPDQGGFIGWTAWRANRHGNNGFSHFNYLQAEDANVYGAHGQAGNGLGIVQGPGNGLMQNLFAKYLIKP